MNIKTLLILIGFGCYSMSSFADVAINEGLWEMTSKMNMSGMPFDMPAATHKQCLSKQDLVPQKPQTGQDCTTKDYKVKGNTVSWKMICSGGRGSQMVSDGKVTYNGDTFSGTMNITTPGSPPIVNNIHGKRLGPCK